MRGVARKLGHSGRFLLTVLTISSVAVVAVSLSFTDVLQLPFRTEVLVCVAALMLVANGWLLFYRVFLYLSPRRATGRVLAAAIIIFFAPVATSLVPAFLAGYGSIEDRVNLGFVVESGSVWPLVVCSSVAAFVSLACVTLLIVANVLEQKFGCKM